MDKLPEERVSSGAALPKRAAVKMADLKTAARAIVDEVAQQTSRVVALEVADPPAACAPCFAPCSVLPAPSEL